MILRSDFNATRTQIHNRLVATAMTELKLFHLSATCQGDHLMSKTDTEDGHLANELFDLMIRFTHSVGVSRTITQENAIGIHRKSFFGRRIPRHNRKLATYANKALKD